MPESALDMTVRVQLSDADRDLLNRTCCAIDRLLAAKESSEDVLIVSALDHIVRATGTIEETAGIGEGICDGGPEYPPESKPLECRNDCPRCEHIE